MNFIHTCLKILFSFTVSKFVNNAEPKQKNLKKSVHYFRALVRITSKLKIKKKIRNNYNPDSSAFLSCFKYSNLKCCNFACRHKTAVLDN